MLAPLLFAAGAAAETSLLAGFALDADSHTQWALPGRLLEISALTVTDDGRLLAVDDERAIIYELDYVEGGLVKAFALGKPVIRGDFEGLAAMGDRVFLMTSEGEIVAAPEGEDGERVSYERYKTEVDSECEFEGLAEDRAKRELLLLCKNVLKKASIEALAIFPWSVDREQIDADRVIELPVAAIAQAIRMRKLHPSGIVVDPTSGNLLVVAAREQALIELDGEGRLIDARRLPLASRHPQAEGIALGPGRLFIADEGGNGRARLSVYRPESPDEDRAPAGPQVEQKQEPEE